MSRWLRGGVFIVPLLSGCPGNDTVGDGRDGETGEDEGGVPIAADPFGGEGEDPPGEPSVDIQWPRPLTLGNGLVHDSRYETESGIYSETFTPAQLAAGVDWATFVKGHALKVQRGFRPTLVDADITIKSNNDTITLNVMDRSVYVSDDDANYKTKIETFLFGNLVQEAVLNRGGIAATGQPRPTSIDTFAVPGGRLGVTVAWVYDDSGMEWETVVGWRRTDFEAKVAKLAASGYRPISVASRRRNGASEYAGIFVRDWLPPDDWHLMLGQSVLELAGTVPIEWGAGYYPVTGTYEQGSQNLPLFNVLWMRRSPGLQLQLRFNMNEILFMGENRHWRQRGYHLEGACAYRDAGVLRYAGLWVRHNPYMRWRDGVEVDIFDPQYTARYLPFHQQAVNAMTLAGTKSEGAFFRPSSTLHILEGGKLVVSRAYTYAGAIYPETPVDATFALASTSKSITAAAVVLMLQQQGISINSSFAMTAGIDNVPAMKPVKIVDVLRNLGGFNEGAESYGDHSLIDASVYGDYPITGEMMYDYAVKGGHLDKYEFGSKDKDSYWNQTTYKASQDPQMPKLTYSNIGFSMLGEMIRVQTGKTYGEFVRSNLLQPLNLDHDIYPDPGHRNRQAGLVTQAGKRSYLINGSHPYNIVGCLSDSDCGYLICDGNDPDPQDCTTATCGQNNVCVGCSADNKTCRPGWACVNDECVNTVVPLARSELIPQPAIDKDGSPRWFPNAGPIDAAVPTRAAQTRYAGEHYMGGAQLTAGGWHGNGPSLGLLVRAIAQSGFLMKKSTASQLWSPVWWNANGVPAPNWYYGLGWYVRGNWVAMAGGTSGSMSLVLHNLAYDFTVVYLSNVKGNAFSEFLNPLLGTTIWSPVGSPCPGNCSPSPTPQSVLGGPFPCIDDLSTQQNECQGFVGAY